MKLSLINARVIDPSSGRDGQYDLHLEEGRLVAIGAPPRDFVADEQQDLSGKLVVPAFADLGA
ncbi:dihydroorotase, partial [Cobetia marina]